MGGEGGGGGWGRRPVGEEAGGGGGRWVGWRGGLREPGEANHCSARMPTN